MGRRFPGMIRGFITSINAITPCLGKKTMTHFSLKIAFRPEEVGNFDVASQVSSGTSDWYLRSNQIYALPYQVLRLYNPTVDY